VFFTDHKVIKMVNNLIGFIKWKGANFESKEKKIIKELSLIRNHCQIKQQEENFKPERAEADRRGSGGA
jgi:hypothetical protein